MFRKWLFGGLTLVLVAVLIGLIIQGNRLGKQKAGQPVEIIQKSVPSATRVFAPTDIQIVQSNMRIEEGTDKSSPSHTVRHEVELRNSGTVAYEKIQLSFDYLDGKGKVLANRTHSVTRTILPDSTAGLVVRMDDVPAASADFKVTVLYADIASASVSGKPAE